MGAASLSDACDTITESNPPCESRRGQKRDTASSTVVAVGATSKCRAINCSAAASGACLYNTKSEKSAWFSSSLSQKRPSVPLSVRLGQFVFPG